MPLKLYRRGKIWHYRGTIAGRRLRGSTGSQSKEIAQQWASQIEQREWKGRLNGPASVLTFAQAAMMYRQAEKSDRFLRPIEDYWKDTPIAQITAGAIRTSAITLYPNAGPATRNRQAIVPTQAIINHAAEHELCGFIRVKRFPVTKTEKTPATWEWVQAFMKAAVKPNLAALACFMFLTGRRITQSLRVTWDDVDLKARTVFIKGTGKKDPGKIVHMPPELVAALANIPEREGPLFGVSSRSNFRTQWAGAVKRAGLPWLSYHRCRHGFATGLLDKGVNPKTVADRGGWKDTRHVFETYAHDVASHDVTDILTGKSGTKSTRQPRKASAAS